MEVIMLSLKKDKKATADILGKIKGHRMMLCLFAMLTLTCLVWQKASALDKLLYQDSAPVFAGGEINLRSYVSEEFLGLNYSGDYNAADADYSISYKWNDENPEPGCATLSADGTVTALMAGTARADVTFTYKDIIQTEIITVEVQEPEQINITYGMGSPLAAAQVYDTGRYVYTSSDESIAVNSDGSVTAYGFNNASIYVSGDNGKKIEVAKINVEMPQFSQETYTRAAGTEAYTPEIVNYTPFADDMAVQWTVDNTIAEAATDGGILAIASGDTAITATITPKKGSPIEITSNMKVTEPEAEESTIVIAEGINKTVKIEGTCDESVINWNIGRSAEGCAYFKKEGKLHADCEGSDMVTVNADGKDIELEVIVTDPSYDGDGISTYKGASSEIEIDGLDDYSEVTFKSKKKAIATVDEDGVVTGKKAGNTVIVVNADGCEIDVPVEIASAKGYKASQKAISISNTKTQYSQAKRMQKGYYDCSSLVWRIYSQYQVYFGVNSGWAPTAADIAKWCADNGKKLYNKAVSSDKLLPGDLIFFSYTKNGRYKNISHVEIYTGQDMDVSASSSNNKVIHYDYSQNDSIVMIARPVQ